jgi:2-keto-4-pentenoate hydratase/2-oxohepta-3-ene-1,7-dioic acid hydratase in catechol pathway
VAAEDGIEHIGEPIDLIIDGMSERRRKTGTTDNREVGAALASGSKVEVRTFTGSSVLTSQIEPTTTILTISRLLPPLSKSEVGTIHCVGLNYRKHAKEMDLALPDHPTLFFKPSTCLGAPNAPLLIPHQATDGQADYEAELAVVIGKAAKNVSKEEAMDYVLGYTCSNDITARVHQFKGAQWGFGKGFDGFAPLGPCLISASSISNPGDIELKTVLNGETMQYSLADDMIFSISEIVAYLSQGTTLEPGTIIMTGTPHGIGVSKVPKVFLKPGDDLRIVMSHGMGSLVTPVEYESAPKA